MLMTFAAASIGARLRRAHCLLSLPRERMLLRTRRHHHHDDDDNDDDDDDDDDDDNHDNDASQILANL